MDGPDVKRFRLRCFAYSLALRWFGQSRFISGTQTVKQQLQVSNWAAVPGPVSILYFLMISLTWLVAHVDRFRGQLPPVRELRLLTIFIIMFEMKKV